MADADNQETSQQQSNQPDLSGIKTELDAKLAEVQAQLQSMNQSFSEGMKALANANKPQKQVEVEDDDIYDPKRLQEKVLSQSKSLAQDMIKRERAKDLMIYNLAQEYPEIQTQADVRKAVLEAQASLPESLQDTAEGYEMAVLKAVSKAGLVAKSKRQSVDPDISVGSGRSASERKAPKKQVSERTLMVAELLRGRELTKEEVQGLETAAQRDSYNRYR